MHRFLSQKFKFYTFVCIGLLLFVHGYNLKVSYLVPFSLVHEKLTFTTFFEYFFANGILRFRIPMLFLISGYIFSIQDRRPYGQRMKRRFVTLIVPYLIWSALGLLMTYLWQQFPDTSQAVQNSSLDQLGDNRPYEQIGWGGILYRWLVAPVSFQLWFIRTLFIYNLLYPVFRWAVTRYPAVTFSILGLLWLLFFHLPYLLEGQGMLFYALGIWLQKSSYAIDRKPEWYSHFLSWLVFVGICVIKTFMAFEFEDMTPTLHWAFMILYCCSTLAGVLAIWFGLDAVVKWAMSRRWFVWATDFSFFVYGLHIPLLAYFTHLLFMYLQNFQWHRLLVYIVAPTIVLLFCIGIGALVRYLFPKAYKAVTGGRGF